MTIIGTDLSKLTDPLIILFISDDDGQTAPLKRTSVDMSRLSRTSHGHVTLRAGEDKDSKLGQSTDGLLVSGAEGV